MAKLFIEDLEIEGKRVLMRVDFNVPLKGQVVENDKRIRAALPSIKYILKNQGRLVLMSHLGRPKGKRVAEMSLEPCKNKLEELLKTKVCFADDCTGQEVESAVSGLEPGKAIVLENLRYYAEETDNDPGFAKKLGKLGDIYVNDAFGTAHRAHASTQGVTRYIDQCAAGFLMKKELDFLGNVMENPEKPFVAILGGAKISGKIDVISSLLPKVDRLIIGGGMAYTFFKAMGLEIGNSLVEADKIEMAGDILDKAGDKIVLPADCMISKSYDLKARIINDLEACPRDSLPGGFAGLDIGPETINLFSKTMKNAKTIVWNGPMGVFEIEKTATGTFAMANLLAELTMSGTTTIIGGGDSASAVEKAGVEGKVSHVSTGGGASLEFLEGKILPGVAALSDK